MNRFRFVVVCAGCILLAVSSCNALAVPHNVSSCSGAFDVYFVLDLSSSLLRGRRNHFKEETVSFVKELVDKFTSPLLRLSFVTFNNYANVVMGLTNDRNIVEAKLQELRYAMPDGQTRLGLGLGKVNDQIQKHGQKRASVVIILTDGILEHLSKVRAVKEANKAREFGATIMAVGVGDFDTDQLLEIVGGSKQLMFKAATFHGLNSIVKRVIDGSCVEIVSAQPDAICANSTFELSITGKGFNKTGDWTHVKCNYWFNETTSFLVTPISHGPYHLKCPSPENIILSPGDVVVLQVTLNGGVSFISSNVTIKAEVCEHSTGAVWAAIVIFGMLLLAILWWFWNALCCVVVVQPKSKPPRPSMPPPPMPPAPITEIQQWPAVDASYYGGRGAGGMHPMRVSWGDRGCTEGAMHLEKAKDAKEVGFVAREMMVEYQPVPRGADAPDHTSSCCNLKKFPRRFFAPFISLYERLSVRRPTSEDVGKCVMVKSQVDVNQNKRSHGSLTGGYLDTSN